MGAKTKMEQIDNRHFLFGLLNAFANRLQAVGDAFFEEISWKQYFVLIGVGMFETPPTISEVAELTGSSHQNVKQILLKLENIGFVELFTDEKDRRKLRIRLTGKTAGFVKKNEKDEVKFMDALYKGLSEKDIAVTKKTLLRMEQNLDDVRRFYI
ncbi:MarR family winged helix-turn-helix transcriptional regulator [Acetivibrio cellulolyticus]|uniref:MarR family winged helix-turn-helix transcriptional regulator n=1 Tax=Acetivibrio cellulolyticus TaxID=35830 RepID=UPI0001E2D894|nr:winged helix DNA-binding protein [Acetivibrio cellulolyticus]